MTIDKNSPSYFMYRPYSLDNARNLSTKVFDCISQLDWTIKEIPKTGRNGIGCIREAELKIHKNNLIKELDSYSNILLRYLRTANQVIRIIRNKSSQIKKDNKRLNSRLIQDIHADLLDRLQYHYTKHRETRDRIGNALRCLRSSLNKPDTRKYLIKRPPDSNILPMMTNTVFTGNSKQ